MHCTAVVGLACPAPVYLHLGFSKNTGYMDNGNNSFVL